MRKADIVAPARADRLGASPQTPGIFLAKRSGRVLREAQWWLSTLATPR
ncbi:MAG: hypothetical protein AAGA08_09090 [Pseudomonadota bacterium]